MSWLESLRIEEISLTEDPNNEEAQVLIVKRRGGALASLQSEVAAWEEQLIEKHRALDPHDAAAAAHIQESLMDAAAMKAALADAETQITELEKSKATAEARVAELEAEVSLAKSKSATPEDEEAEFIKSLPEAARARYTAQRDRLAEIEKSAKAAEEKAAVDAEIAKAKGLGLGDTEAKSLGELLHRVQKGKTTPEDAGVIEGIVKSARALDGKAAIFKTVGGAGGADLGSDVDPDTALRALAAEIRKSKPELTEAAAYELAMERNPELYVSPIEKSRRGK